MEVTMLNAMASESFEASLELQREWGLRLLDLKDGIYGKGCLELSDAEAERAVSAIQASGLGVYCLTTELFKSGLELGEREFGRIHRPAVGRMLELAAAFRPAAVRVLTPRLADRGGIRDAPAYLADEAPWLYGLLRETADRLADAGISLCIENEPEGSVFSRPDEIVDFFRRLDRPGRASFTYDAQNLWQMGMLPSLAVYREISAVTGYLHVKGGIADPATGRLRWRSTLERASWPVAAVVAEALKDGRMRAICLNPSHGIANDEEAGVDPVRADLDYVRKLIDEQRN